MVPNIQKHNSMCPRLLGKSYCNKFFSHYQCKPVQVRHLGDYIVFLARDAFVRTNRRVIAMMFIRISVCLRRACIVIIQYTLAEI